MEAVLQKSCSKLKNQNQPASKRLKTIKKQHERIKFDFAENINMPFKNFCHLFWLLCKNILCRTSFHRTSFVEYLLQRKLFQNFNSLWLRIYIFCFEAETNSRGSVFQEIFARTHKILISSGVLSNSQ